MVGGDVFRADKDDLSFIDQFASTSNRVEDMDCDPVTFAPIEVMWVRHTPQGIPADDIITAHEIEPGTCGVGGQPPIECPNPDIYVTTTTPIWLSCKDPEPHPVDQETLCYKVSLHDGQGFDDITPGYCEPQELENGWCCEYVGNEPFEFHFKEQSHHDLEYFCEDHLGNKGEEHIQFYFVEDTPPITTKTYEGPFYLDPVTGFEYIDTATKVVLTAKDPEPHPSGVHKTYWKNILVEDSYCESRERCNSWQPNRHEDSDWNLYTGPFSKDQESCHIIEFYSDDNLWNMEEVKWQCVFVDKQPPVIEKEFSEHHFTCLDWCEEEGLNEHECLEMCDYNSENDEWFPQWISSETEILINATDPEPHPSGVKEVKYRKTLVDDKYCNDIDLCQLEAQGSGNFIPLVGNSCTIDKESCHLIEIMATDNVGKTSTHKQCIFVDNRPPVTNKTVGDPKIKWNGTDSVFYPNETKHCWDNTGNEIECWKVTIMTPIKLDCSDPEPHPVDHEMICYNIGLDGEDVTEDYCEKTGGEFNESGDGYCCITGENAPVEFHFVEESEHNLKYYCVDALWNKGEIDEEKFKVEGDAFEIWINKKWNLISTPVKLLDDSMDDAFDNPNEKIESVWQYDAENDEWHIYTPDGFVNDDLTTMIPGEGYFVLANDMTSIIIGGSLISPAMVPPSKTIVEGWNLIGYYGVEGPGCDDGICSKYHGPVGNGRLAECSLNSLGESELDKGWTSLWTYWEPDNPNQWHDLSGFDNMDPGAGYWLFAPDDGIYAPSTTCGFLF